MIFVPKFSHSEKILPEYPRPQKQRDSYYSLNGEWQYKFSQSDLLTESFDGEIIVPYSPESRLSGVNRQLKKDEYLHLKKVFSMPKGFFRGRVFLNVGACDQVTRVYLNGKLLYTNTGGYTSFTVELVDILKTAKNTLYFVVADNADSDVYGRGKQKYKRGGIWYTATSGIWQSCFLESTPDVYIKDFKYYIDYDAKKLRTEVEVSDGVTPVHLSVMDGSSVIAEGDTDGGTVTLDVSACAPWEIDDPQLYPVVLTVGDDKITSYFGLRKFSKVNIDGRFYFAVNNKPVYLNGLLDQGYHEDGIYTPSSNKVMYDEIKSLKELGFNMLRKHIKVEPMLWYYYCDITGMIVWQDMINGGGKYSSTRVALCPFFNMKIDDGDYKAQKRDNPESRRQYKYEANRLIDQLFNVTSLMLWTPFNEAWGQFDAIENWRELSKKDNTRLYDHASGWQDMGGGDVQSKHIYFKKIKLKNDRKRVLALTEFGGYSMPIKGHVFTRKKFGYKSFKDQKSFEEAYARLFENQIIPMIKSQGLSASCYTQVSDVEDEINGIYTYDRVLKINPEILKRVAKEVYSAFYESLK